MPNASGLRARLPARLRSRPLGLAGRVFAGTAGVVVAVVLAALLAATASVRRAGDAAAQRGLEQAADLVAQFLAGRQRALAGGARVFAQGPYFRSLVAAERRDDVLDQAFEGAEQLDASWVFITDAAGRLLAKSDEPGAAGGPLGGVPLVAGALRGQVTSGFGASGDTLLFQAVAVPVAVPGSTPVGVLVATKVVDDRLARDVRAATAADVVFYALDAAGRSRVTASSFAHADEARRALAAAGPAVRGGAAGGGAASDAGRAPVRVGGVAYLAQGGGATTAGGETVGGFVVLRRLDLERAELAGVQRSLVAAGVVGLALALAAAWATARRITRPVRVLAAAARRAAEGDYRADDVLRASRALPGDAFPDTALPAGEVPAWSDGAAGEGLGAVGLGAVGPGADEARADEGAGDEIAALGAAFGALLTDLRDRAALDRAALDVVRAFAAGADRRRPGGMPNDTTHGSPHGMPHVSSRAAAARTPAAARHALRAAPALALARAGDVPGVAGLAPGVVLAGRYALEAILGAGGTGVVWRARDQALGETVALKVLRPELAAAGAPALERFKDELRLARRLTHRNVVRLHDLGADGEAFFVTMEYVEGASLAALLAAHGALPPAAVLSVAKQLTRALDVAHAHGVLHGDVKPANLLVGAGGVLKVTDFGVARLMRAPVSAAAGAAPRAAPDIAGAVVGTPSFMAPELLVGAAPSVRTDLYSAGLVLHACLTGATPFDGDTPVAFFARKLDGRATGATAATPAAAAAPVARAGSRAGPVRAEGVAPVAAVVERLTAHDPAARPASARAAYALFARLG